MPSRLGTVNMSFCQSPKVKQREIMQLGGLDCVEVKGIVLLVNNNGVVSAYLVL